jgi:hypothetical protein
LGLVSPHHDLEEPPGAFTRSRFDIVRPIETIGRSQIGQGPDTDRDNRWALRPNGGNIRESWGNVKDSRIPLSH